MSLFRRPHSRPKPLEPNENAPSSDLIPPSPVPRFPLLSIPDPCQNPGEESGLGKLATPRSEQSTPGWAASRARGKGVKREVVRGGGEVVGSVEGFELEEDPGFWRDQNVQVLIRIRPIQYAESTMLGYGRCVMQESSRTLTWTGHPEARFTFDNIACESISQEAFFKAVGLPMVDNCLSGYNSCMFAYGQTGSGKTYTMMGEIRGEDNHLSEARGMTPRIFEYLFMRIQEEEESRIDEKLKYSCTCSFLEIYNEHITDLLDPSSTNLQLREDMNKGVYVENLSKHKVYAVEDVLGLLLQGAANRKVAATNMNSESSRSHSLFMCTVESQWEKDGLTHLRFSRLNLVDLAGSERQKSSRAEGERLKEAANINKSLSTLSLVIMTLVDIANGKHRHVPYRDSKLTFLLQDSLGGNSKTIIIANVNPSIPSASETLSTLKFAQRAKLIQNNAKVNEDASGDHMALQRQIQTLKDQLTFFINHQNVTKPLDSHIKNPENVKGVCGYLTSANGLEDQVLQPNSQPACVDAILLGALRREQMAEAAMGRLEAENEHMSRLVSERDDDAQRTKMMLRLREDKIRRLQLLVESIISAQDYLSAENSALHEEIHLLQQKLERNPELTRFALENVRLLNQLRVFQNFYQKGEREMLLAEVTDLRSQILRLSEEKGHQTVFPTIELKETNEVQQDPISNFQSGTACNVELGNCRERMDACAEINLRLARENKDLRCLLKYISSSKGAHYMDDVINSIGGSECETHQVHNNELNEVATSVLHSKLDMMGKGEYACISNTNLHRHAISQSVNFEMDKVQQKVDSKVQKGYLVEQQGHWKDVTDIEIDKQELQQHLYSVTQENNRLLELLAAKEVEISTMTEEWGKATTCLTNFLENGCRSLQDVSGEIENIINSYPCPNIWAKEHVEKAIKIFHEKEDLIHNLKMKLEDAQEVGLDMSLKMELLKGATLALTEKPDSDENAKELLYLKELLGEKISIIQDLQDLVQCRERKVIEIEKQALAAFIIIKRLYETDRVKQSAAGEMDQPTIVNNFGQKICELQVVEHNLTEIRKKVGIINENLRLSAKSREWECIEMNVTTREMEILYSSLTEVYNMLDLLIDSLVAAEGFQSMRNDSHQPILVENSKRPLDDVQVSLTSNADELERQQSIENVTAKMPQSDNEKRVADAETQQTSCLLQKFDEAQRTMKDAELIMNSLLELNEKTKLEKDKWKLTSTELFRQSSVLAAEITTLKASVSSLEEEYQILQNQVNENLMETLSILSSCEDFFHQIQDYTSIEVEIISSNIISVRQETFDLVGTSKTLTEELIFKMMENDFFMYTLYQCYLGACGEKMMYSLEAGGVENTLVHGHENLQGRNNAAGLQEQKWNGRISKQVCGFCDHDMVGIRLAAGSGLVTDIIGSQACDIHNLNYDATSQVELWNYEKSSRSSVDDNDVPSDIQLKTELARKDTLLRGLLFDLKLLQESTSGNKDLKDETQQMSTILSHLRCDLEAKTTQVDEMMFHNKELEARLVESEAALGVSSSDLLQANRNVTSISNEKMALEIVVEEIRARNMDIEQQLQYRDKVIAGLEREIICISSSVDEKVLSAIEEIDEELKRITGERDHLCLEVASLNEKLEMTSALADENEAIAVEARQVSEASRVHAEEKEEEVKVLECSIGELEQTIDVLERKVHNMTEEVEKNRTVREDLEQELHVLKQRIISVETAAEISDMEDSGSRHKIQLPWQIDGIAVELREAKNHIQSLEMEREKHVKEIDNYRKHIAELVLHSEAQSALYQQKFKMLEAMVAEGRNNQPHAKQAAFTPNKSEKGSTRTRGSGSPFKCIASIYQQMNMERDHELSEARGHIEELETLVANRQKEVCKLNARLEVVDHMTHDVIRDLLEVKLDMTNYANLIDQDELLKLLYKAEQQNEANIAKDQEILNLRNHIAGLMEEHDSLIEEQSRIKAEILAARVAVERYQQQDQFLTAQNKLLKSEKVNLTRKIAELDKLMKNLVRSQSVEELIQHRNFIMERFSRGEDEGFSVRLAKADKLLTLAKSERIHGGISRSKGKHSVGNNG